MQKSVADVVVVGSGAAGFGAAIAAAEGGASVVVIEKRKQTGGISVTGMGVFAVESRLQREKNHQLTRDDAFKIFMEKTHWKPNARLVRAYIDKTASTIDWLEDMGIEFVLEDQMTFPGCVNQTGHLVVPPNKKTGPAATAHMIRKMQQRALQLGVDLLLETKLTDLKKVDGSYQAFIENVKGEKSVITAKSVVIASGGYSDNKDMLAKNGFTLGEDMWVGHSLPLTGEGIQMAWKLGAVSDGMCPQLTALMPGGNTQDQPRELISLVSWGLPYLWVNKHGERFIDEGDGNAWYTCNAVARQPQRVWYSIFDENTKEYLETNGVDVAGYFDNSDDIGALVKKATDKGAYGVFTADSLDELAEKMQVPKDRFKKTVEDYNECCKNGLDTLFAKNRKYLRRVDSPKYYGFLRTLGAYGTVGGIKINEYAQAMDKDDMAIPGLFAAGDCANGTHTHNYSLVYILWGSTLGFAVNSGRIAGENAAQYIKNA